jgi:hypothetical protein
MRHELNWPAPSRGVTRRPAADLLAVFFQTDPAMLTFKKSLSNQWSIENCAPRIDCTPRPRTITWHFRVPIEKAKY